MTITVDPEAALARLQHLASQVNTEDEAREVASQIRTFVRKIRASRWEPYLWQHPHVHPEGWASSRAPGVCDETCATLPRAVIPVHGAWLELGGRGTGKTEGAAQYVNNHVENGPPCDTRVPGGHRLTIVAPTQADAVTSCVTGVSGLQMINPGISISTTKEGTLARWPNGSVARVVGAHTPVDIDRLRAWTNVCCAWVEEAAAQRHLGAVLDQLPFTLRLGDRPHSVITTTPKNRPEVAAMTSDPRNIQTKGRTRDAHRMHPAIRAELEKKFGGTTLGRQELDAEELGDVEGALWVYDRPDTVDGQPNRDERPGIENDRVSVADYGWNSHRPEAPKSTAKHLMHRVVIAVDPPGGRTECGIVVVGSIGNHGYTLGDLSLAGPPDTWARVVIDAYLDYGAEGIAAEHTYGGDMVSDVISVRAAAMGLVIPIFKVPTKVGKRLRAEPVQGLCQQHRIHTVGTLPGLEGEQTAWVPGEGESPNRVDAYVHGHTFLLIRTRAGSVTSATSASQRVNSPWASGGRR